MNNFKPRLFTVIGPSGSGKTTLVRQLLKTGLFTELVSVTTRKPRVGETEGIDYYYISPSNFEELRRLGRLTQSVSFNGVSYGVTQDEVEKRFKSGKHPIVIVEPTGVSQYQEIFPDLITIFIDSPLELLYSRYLNRVVLDAQTKSKEVDIDYHAKRLISIIEEKEDWKLLLEVWGIDFLVPVFTPENEKEVLDKLLNFVKKL